MILTDSADRSNDCWQNNGDTADDTRNTGDENHMTIAEITVAEYLLERLKEIGVDHLFGVPGDFVLGFFNEVLKSDVEYIGTCNELNAAYAADGYARIRGVGAFASTFGVGELSAINGVAGAFAERVPVVVITGAPSTENFRTQPLLHHTLGDYRIPFKMYQMVTVASTQLESGATAPAEIDRVLTACLVHQQPVYISLPSDVVRMKCSPPTALVIPHRTSSNIESLNEAADEAAAMLTASVLPVIVGGVDLIRFSLQDKFSRLIERTGIPYVTMMLAKTLLSEQTPQFIGLFEGERSRAEVRERVDAADCILQLGSLLTDFNTGGFTAHFNDDRTISASLDYVKIKHHVYPGVFLGDFIAALIERLQKRDSTTLQISCAAEHCVHRKTNHFHHDAERPITVQRFFDRLSHVVEPDAILIAETGVSLFSAAEMLMPDGVTFIGQTFYGSIGYTLGAALGACIAAPHRQVILFIGDGSFQVTCQDLSTMIRNKLRPRIFLLNNDGYTIERVIVDRSYNDLQPWKYHQLPGIFGGEEGMVVRNEGELEHALEQASAADSLVFIEVRTGRMDCPDALRSAGHSMAVTNHLLEETSA